MRRIWGGLLVFVAGLVLAVTGVGSSDGGAVGALQCGVQVGVPVVCPTGTITVTSVTQGAGQRPAAWSLTIDSPNCPIVDDTFDVPEGGQAVSPDLFAFTTSQQDTPCEYSLAETVVAGFTPTFDPAAPYEVPTGRNATLAVTLTNTGAVVTTAPPTTTAPTTTAPATTGAATVTARPTASRPTLANTGPATTVRWTLWLGLATSALGVVLVAVGWRSRSPQRQQH